jgi:radical SAM protein with 4Fe4S-binding SPASM domain
MQTLSYSEFSKRLTKQIAGRRVPLSGTIELTNRCPLNCSHCYNNLPMNDAAARKRELSTAEYIAILDQLADAGCMWVCFSGGEIFARRDFFDIYDHAKSKGFVITLFTNGVLIDERVADRLAKAPPFIIEITLYGRTQETYDELTQIPGSWAKCMRGIQLLLARNLPLKLKTVAVSVNRHEVYEMKDFARELGVEFKFDAMMNPRIDCSAAPLSVRLTPVEAVELDLRDPARITAYQGLAAERRPQPKSGEAAPIYDCGGGTEAWAIDPYGDLTICVLSHVDSFNLREYSFAEAWDLLSAPRAKRATRETKCTHCAMKAVCGMCPAFAELENSDPETPVDYLCHVTHLRAEVLGFEVPEHGACEYCATGSERDTILREAAEVNVAAFAPSSHFAIPAPSECASGNCSCSTR